MTPDLHPLVPQQIDQAQFLLPAPPRDRFFTAATLRAQLHRCRTALRRRWWVFLLTFLLIGGPAILYAITRPPTFRSEAVLWLASKLTLLGSGGGDRLSSTEDTTYVGTQAELIKSLPVQARAFEKVRAAFPQIAPSTTNADPEHLPFKVTVTTSLKNSVVELEAKGPSPEATRAFLDAVMGEYFALKKDSLKRTSSGALSSITDQIKDVEKQIQRQQDEMTRFQMSNNVPYLTEHGLSAGSQLAALTQVLSDLRTEYHLLGLITPEQFKDLAKGSQYSLSDSTVPGEKASRALALNANWAADTAYYQALQQVEVLKAKRDEFSQVLRPTHSKMVKLNQEIAGLDQFLKTLKGEGGQQALAQMANRKKSLELQIQNLESQYRVLETNAAEASRKLTEYDRVKEDLQRSQALYDRLLGLLQTVDLNNNMDQESLTAIGPASAARPTLTKYKLAAAGLFLAFVAALGLMVLLELLDDRFTLATELSYYLPDQVVGQIPESRLNRRNGKPRLLRHPEEQHAFAESFRNLRSCLFFMFEEGARPKIILLTSAIPKEGKSTVAANLASSLAASGSRVLLIDADLRRSSLHKLFGVSLGPGLREVLSQAVPVADAIVPVHFESASDPRPLTSDLRPPTSDLRPPASGLFLLPAGTPGPETSELFLRSQVPRLLRDLAAQYGYVIIDSPPVLATNDVMGLASMADGVFMVVRALYTSSRMVCEALDRMHRCNAKVVGIIYNRAARSTDYYSRYSREYHNRRGANPTAVSDAPA
jgi:Mrp family chromosome partitioning ATPase/uncharacterized protein involved in exopolysaccharide biosynthesis